MSDALKFKVDLVGNMVAELVAGGKAANTAEGGVQALTAAILEMTEAGKKKESSFFTFDLAKGADMAIGLIGTLAGKVYDLGREIVHAAAGAQDLRVALAQTAGADNVAGINSLADSFGDTRFDDDEIKRMILPLLNVGLGKGNPAILQDIVTAATDTAARLADPAATGAVLEAFQRIHTKREVSAKMLLGVGINEQDFYTSLGQTLGTSAKTAEAQVKAGKVRAETLEAELLAAIAKREGGSLGKATDESAKTLGTTLARLENLPENLFKQLADSPGLALLQDRVNNFIDTLSGPAGARIVESLGGALDKVSAYLLGNGDAADKFINAIIEGVPRMVKVLEGLWDILKYVVDTTKDLVDGWDRVKNVLARAGEGAVVGAGVGSLGGGVGAIPGAAIGAVVGAIHASYENDANAAMPKANDFIWRGGKAVQIDPNDSIVGAKKGGSLGLDDIASGGRGGTFAPVYAPVYQISGGASEDAIRRVDEGSRVEFARLVDEWRAREGAAA